jgi:hypothetical protein
VQVRATLVVGAGIDAAPNAVYVPKFKSAIAAIVHTEVRETVTLKGAPAVAANPAGIAAENMAAATIVEAASFFICSFFILVLLEN